MAEAERKYQVEIISRSIVITYPKIRVPVRSVMVTYAAADLPPYSITILLDELFPNRTEEAAEQIKARKGPLWEEYLKVEKERIRKSIEERLPMKPEVYVV